MKSEDRIALEAFPDDWRYYTLTFPVARYKRLSLDGIIEEMLACNRSFYSLPRILRRVWGNVWRRRQPLISLVGNLSYRSNIRVDCQAYADFKRARHDSFRPKANATANPCRNEYENHPSLSQPQRPSHLAPPGGSTAQAPA
jgi:hypothetical protein